MLMGVGNVGRVGRPGGAAVPQGGGVPTTLGALGVNPASITENSAPGAIVGAIVGMRAGSAITITGTAGSRFTLSGSNVVAGATNTDYETATSYDITLRETNAAYPNSPKDTIITIAVADVNTLLAALTLSASSIQENSVAGTVVGTIQNTSGGTITLTDTAGSRFALGSGGNAGKVVAGAVSTDYESATTHNITLTETLGESSNSPRNTVLAIAVTDVVSEIATYAQFVAAETARSTAGATTWAGAASGLVPNGIYRVTAAADSGGGMLGTPWQSGAFSKSSYIDKILRHCFPSAAVFNANSAAGRMITFTCPSNLTTTEVFGVDRNGYASSDSGGPVDCFMSFQEIRYWDPIVGPVKMNIGNGTGPTPYTLGT